MSSRCLGMQYVYITWRESLFQCEELLVFVSNVIYVVKVLSYIYLSYV
jgi:hypothetical protein